MLNKSPLLHLPEPGIAEQQLSHQLKSDICAEIADKGPMTFARYMELALYAPSLGYYRSGLQKFGQQGDFITAPELSPLFSQCVAYQCQQVLEQLEGGDILEFGAGSGIMARIILQELARLTTLPEYYYILEVSAELRHRQQNEFKTHAPELLSKVIWLEELPAKPLRGVILANEVLDAMPVNRFGYLQNFVEYYVDVKDDQLVWRLGPLSSQQLVEHLERLKIKFTDGYSSEINLWLEGWMASVSQCLVQGVVLLTDYGLTRREYYHPDRGCGTIMCHYRHRAHSNPFWWPGIQDMTAQVDFTAVALAAEAAQLNVHGYTHQAGFLLNCGILELIAVDDPQQRKELTRQAQRLITPGDMGEPFKAMALTKEYDAPLMGFTIMNQLERL